MSKFGDNLKVGFFEGNRLIVPRENYKHTKLSDDGSLYLYLNSEKDRAILDLILKVNVLHIDGFAYRVITREFMLDGTALYVVVEKIEKQN